MFGCNASQVHTLRPHISPLFFRFCKAHAPPEYVNIKNRACSHKGCGKQAWKGLKSSAGGAGSALFCAKHAVGAGYDFYSPRHMHEMQYLAAGTRAKLCTLLFFRQE